MQDKTPRLRFTEDELKNPSVEHAAQKAEKAADQADAVKARLPTKKRKLKHEDEIRAQRKEQLRFGKAERAEEADSPTGSTASRRGTKVKADEAEMSEEAAPDVPKTDDFGPEPAAEGAPIDAAPEQETGRPSSGRGKRNRTATSERSGTTKPDADPGLQSGFHQEANRISPHASRLRFDKSSEEIKAPPKRRMHRITSAFSGETHRRISEYEDENVGIEAAHRSEEFTESTAETIQNGIYGRKARAYGRAAKLERKADKANINALYEQQRAEDPELFSNPISRRMQKRNIRKQYYAEKAAGYANAAGSASAKGASGAGTAAAEKAGEAKDFIMKLISENKKPIAVLFLAAAAILLIVTLFQSCGTVATGVISGISATSWPADMDEINAAEDYYTALETALEEEIYAIESTYSADEYEYNIAEIGHDATLLVSYLCAKYGAFTFEEVQADLDELFALQYSLTTESTTETRTTTKTVQAGEYIGEVVTSGYCPCTICCGKNANGITATGTTATANRTVAVDASNPIVPVGTQVIINGVLYTVEDTGNFSSYGVDFDIFYDTHSEALAHGHQTVSAYYAGGDGDEIEVTVTETVEILSVTLTAADFEELLLSRMTEEEQELYEVYNTSGLNVAFLTDDSDLPTSVGTATGKAAALIEEAISHLGTPYVWGGYSPSGFDCSGFVSYCLTYSGALNTGHLNCKGLYALCTIIDKSELQPGDLVFFQGTYNTDPPSHVGIVRPDRTIVEVVKGGCR